MERSSLRLVESSSHNNATEMDSVSDVHTSAFEEVQVKVPAKINIYFQVADVRPDGYHDVMSVYCAISIYEVVTVSARTDDQVTLTVENNISDENVSEEIPLDENNLAVKAVVALAGQSQHFTGVDIHIEKNIPVAAGLAGGSADAAGVLVACNALWGDHHSRQELEVIGARLGADVPFSIMGGAALGQGTGRELTPIISDRSFWWVIAPAQFGLSTPKVFSHLDAQREVSSQKESEKLIVDPDLVIALRRGDINLLAQHIHNDLQETAVDMVSDTQISTLEDVALGGDDYFNPIEHKISQGMQNGALVGFVTGSGPTVVFLVDDKNSEGVAGYGYDNAHSLAQEMNAQNPQDPECIVAQGPVDGAIITSAH